MVTSKKDLHDFLEDTLLTLRNYVKENHEYLDDIELYDLLKLIREMERIV